MKKAKCIVISLLLCLGLLGGAFPALADKSQEVCQSFGDIDSTAWYHEAVDFNLAHQIMTGLTPTSFAPLETMGETDFIEALHHASGLGDDGRTKGTACLAWAKENGITAYMNGDGRLTREEMVAMVYQGLKASANISVPQEGVVLSYTDAGLIASSYQDAVLYCTQNNIITGEPDGSLRPQDPCIRAEAAVVLQHYWQIVEQQKADPIEALYAAALVDAKTIEPEEILPVTAITKDSPMVTWNESGDRVLLLTWHQYPDSYQPGTEVTTDWGEVWTFTDREMKKWFAANHEGVKDWDLRFKELIGLAPNKEYTHFSALWVKPEDIIRPSYVPDITQSVMTDYFTGQVDEAYQKWFEETMEQSYVPTSGSPWTRLGYTYDWADNGTEFGLSEFLIRQGSDVQVEFTYVTDEFLHWLKQQI